MTAPQDRNEDRVRAARRDLERLDEQSEKLLGGGSGGDTIDVNDPIEVWGRRIGRGAGLLFVIYLLYTLSRYFSFGAGTG